MPLQDMTMPPRGSLAAGGLNAEIGEPPICLTPSLVDEIHEVGGTMLGTSRGPQPIEAMVDFLVDREILILAVLSGFPVRDRMLARAQNRAGFRGSIMREDGIDFKQ
jgi:hypothetical protein